MTIGNVLTMKIGNVLTMKIGNVITVKIGNVFTNEDFMHDIDSVLFDCLFTSKIT